MPKPKRRSSDWSLTVLTFALLSYALLLSLTSLAMLEDTRKAFGLQDIPIWVTVVTIFTVVTINFEVALFVAWLVDSWINEHSSRKTRERYRTIWAFCGLLVWPLPLAAVTLYLALPIFKMMAWVLTMPAMVILKRR